MKEELVHGCTFQFAKVAPRSTVRHPSDVIRERFPAFDEALCYERRIRQMLGTVFTSERRLFIGVLLTFVAVALLAALDIDADLREGTAPAHVAAEGGVLLLALFGSVFMTRRLVLTMRHASAVEKEALALAGELEVTRAEASRWKSEARDLVRGLAEAIDQQFDRWSLTAAEKEVALLLLKGLSHKEIAAVRSVTEATARQQARAVYKKSGLSGRHDLAAFFLEDLMLPMQSR
jgi:DNA-binding CsgD family transcriptional regulator